MKTRIEDLWDATAQEALKNPILGDELRLIRTDPGSASSIYVGIDAVGRRLLAFGFSAVPTTIDVQSQSFDCFRLQRANGSWLVGLRLSTHALASVFARLCQDLADEAARVRDEGTLAALVRRRLELWSRLFSARQDGVLASQEVRGLVAEMLALEHFIDRCGARDAVSAWTGPGGSCQDFIFADSAYEIKAVRERALEVSISSLEQLESDRPLQLHVLVLETRSVPAVGFATLNAIVTRIESCIAPDPDALALFRDRLLEAGYVERPEYSIEHHKGLSWRHFAVVDDFPRLTRGDAPPGVTAASYSIALAAAEQFRVEGQVK